MASAQLISSESSGVIYVVLEYGDIDLARLLAKQEAARRATPGAQPDENFIRLFWQQMLQVCMLTSPSQLKRLTLFSQMREAHRRSL